LKLNGIVIGWSELEEVDEVDRRVWGQFHPGIGYELVQPIFRLFVEATPMPGGEPRDQIKLEQYIAAATSFRSSWWTIAAADRDRRDPHRRLQRKARSDAMSLDVLVKDDGYWAERS
jgi:hypothetical protein